MATCFTLSLMFLLMTADVDGQQDWAVNYSPSDVCSLRGSTVRMSCIYSPGHQVTSSYWTITTHQSYSVSQNLCSDTNYREKVQCNKENTRTNSITLTHVTEDDKGVYYCIFTSRGLYSGEWRGVPGVQLDVTDLQVETQQRVKEGDSVTLTCKTTCRLTEETTFIWSRNTQTLTEHTVKEFHLQSVSRHDSGLYRCAIRGHERLSSPGVYLSVEYVDGQQDWGVNYNPSYVCALRGSTVRMSCTLKFPPDHVVNKTFWTKTVVPDVASPDLCLNPEDRRVLCHSENKYNHSITLTDVTEADKHVYYCRFTTIGLNEVWTGVPGVQLDVTDLQVETQQRVKERDSVTLTCKTTCRLTEETTFIWSRNTQTLTEHTVKEFHLQSVSRHDSGLYRCAIRGHERLSSPGVDLSVEYPPEKTSVSISSSGVIVEGDSVNLTCSSESNPPVHIYSWCKENQTSSVGSGQTFSITNINSRLSGWFYCVAQNKHGSQRSAAVSLTDKGVQGSAVVSGIVAGCGGLFFIIIFIILFIKKRRTDSRAEYINQTQTADSSDDRYTALNPASRTSADIYSTIRSDQCRADDGVYTTLDLQSRSSEYDTLAVNTH